MSSYRTSPGEHYCGTVISAEFVRHGFYDSAKMRLDIHPDSLQQQPGMVTTSDGVLTNAILKPISWLQNDPLSELQFGQGRSRNVVLEAVPSDGVGALVVVSFMDNSDIEVRVLRAAFAAGSDGDEQPRDNSLFGVFPLKKEKGTCGF